MIHTPDPNWHVRAWEPGTPTRVVGSICVWDGSRDPERDRSDAGAQLRLDPPTTAVVTTAQSHLDPS